MAAESVEDFIAKNPADVAIFLKGKGISEEICEKFEGKTKCSAFNKKMMAKRSLTFQTVI